MGGCAGGDLYLGSRARYPGTMSVCSPSVSSAARPGPAAPGAAAAAVAVVVRGRLRHPEKRRDLRKMKLVATGFLVFATVVYLFCRWQETRGAARGSVTCGPHRSRHGGCARRLVRGDGAVPASARAEDPAHRDHQAQEDQLGGEPQQLRRRQLLAPDVVSAKVANAQIPLRVGTWMAEPEHAQRVAAETATLLRGVVEVLNDEDVTAIIDNTIVRRSPTRLGSADRQGPRRAAAREPPAAAVDLLAERAHQGGSEQSGDHRTASSAGTRRSGRPSSSTRCSARRSTANVVEFTWRCVRIPSTRWRLAANRFLIDFADDLQNDPATIAKAEYIQGRDHGREEITGLAGPPGRSPSDSLMESVDDPNSTRARKVAENVVAFGERCATTTRCARRSTAGCCRARATSRELHGRDPAVITETVERWDARGEPQDRRLQVGSRSAVHPDQRPVVGALAGLRSTRFRSSCSPDLRLSPSFRQVLAKCLQQ